MKAGEARHNAGGRLAALTGERSQPGNAAKQSRRRNPGGRSPHSAPGRAHTPRRGA